MLNLLCILNISLSFFRHPLGIRTSIREYFQGATFPSTALWLVTCGIVTLGTTLHCATSSADTYQHQSLHDVHLANTEHELHIYRIYGKEPGKTIMLVGGIQGDEPGGYLTADLYADISLKKGNLIVVPRANFYSILLNQRDGLTGDMNRKFSEKSDADKNMEQEIVTILKKLIGEADCLLNLHEGSGFYNQEWKSDIENPDRFGQSIIFDAKTYFSDKKQTTINLESLAKQVVEKVNQQIDNNRYHFQPNNHDTISETTRHLEQRKSATYYALTQEGIPAFGVETSKSIKSNSAKVGFQKLVINAFMEEFGIIPETPGLHSENTKLDYVLVRVNGGLPYAVSNGADLPIDSGDEVIVTDIIANFNRGLTADFVNMGNHNDTKLPFHIASPTKVLIRKDAETCGFINIVIKSGKTQTTDVSQGPKNKMSPGKSAPSSKQQDNLPVELRAEKLLLNVNGELVAVSEGEEIVVSRDKLLIIRGVRTNISKLDNQIMANLKGFSPSKAKNDGNDINYPLYPQHDLLSRFSEDKKGLRYPINATYNNKEIGSFWLKLN
ncbi:MAG: M14/M99 family metallopeptidase [Desulforhopalus sp.]|nr:M14/M99 family metallopeptidase [Desulforhopalus sp.]